MPNDKKKKQDHAPNPLALAIERKDYDFLIFYYTYLAPDQNEVDKILQNNPRREFAKPLNSKRNRVLKMILPTKKEMSEKFKILVEQTNRTDDDYFCIAIACCHFYGIATPKNAKRAIVRWEKIMENPGTAKSGYCQENLDYCKKHNLGFKEKGGDSRAVDERIEWFREEGDCAFSQYQLFHLVAKNHRKKKNVALQYRLALQYLIKSAEQGYSVAQFNLSYIYRNGEVGVEKDLKKAHKYCLLAGNNEYLPSLLGALGIDYINGLPGVIERDLDESVFWLKQGANFGSPRDQFCLYILGKENGFQIISEEEALEWLKKSAAQDYPNAVATLSEITVGECVANAIKQNDPDAQMPSEVNFDGIEEDYPDGARKMHVILKKQDEDNRRLYEDDFLVRVKKNYDFGFLVFCHICIIPNKEELEKLAPYAQLEKNQIEKFLDSNKEFKQSESFVQILELIKKLVQSKEDKGGVLSNIVAGCINYDLLEIPNAIAKTYYAKAAEKGIRSAKFMLAKIMNNEDKDKVSQDKAIAMMMQLAKKEYIPAMYFLSLNLYELCLLDKDLNNTFGKQAFRWANKLVSEVSYEEEAYKLILSNFYFNGIGTKKSNERGMQILEELVKEGAVDEAVLEKKKKELEEEKKEELRRERREAEKKAKKDAESQKEKAEEEKQILEKQKVEAEAAKQVLIDRKRAAIAAKKLQKRQARSERKAAAEAEQLRQQQEEKVRLEKEEAEKAKIRLEKEKEDVHSKLQCKTPEASYQLNQSLVEIHKFLLDSGIFDELSLDLKILDFQIKLKGSFLYQFYLTAYDREGLKPKDIDLEIIMDLRTIDQSFKDNIREIFGLNESRYKAEEWRGRDKKGPLENIVFKPKNQSLSNSSLLMADGLQLEVIIRDPKHIDPRLDWVCNFDRLRVCFDKEGFELQSIGEPLVSHDKLIGNIRSEIFDINHETKPPHRIKYYFDKGILTKDGNLKSFLEDNKYNPEARRVINYVTGLQKPSTVCELKIARALIYCQRDPADFAPSLP